MALSGMISVDGQLFRFMGPGGSGLADKAATQTIVRVLPTRTQYVFEAGGVELTLEFLTPAFDINDWAQWPITYLTYSVAAKDGKTHSVKLYYDNSAEVAIASTSQPVAWSRGTAGSLTTMRIGTHDQAYVNQTSDLRDWGYWYVAFNGGAGVTSSMAGSLATRSAFMNHGPLPADDTRQPRPASDDWPVLAVVWDLGTIGSSISTVQLITGYDEVYAMNFFGTKMPPLWTTRYDSFASLLSTAQSSFVDVSTAMATAENDAIVTVDGAGGAEYATLYALIHRQVTGSTKWVYNPVRNTTWAFMKEISSDGDVSTVDVLYPAAPHMLLFNPEQFRLMLLPLLEYAANKTGDYGLNTPYNLPWSPHHLGVWPICDLRADQQEQMPVEESANFLIMLAAIADVQKVSSTPYLEPYWALLRTWADYIISSLPDPGNQLCTDDFEGPSPHNVNLAAKGIVGLGAFSKLLRLNGFNSDADHYMQQAQGFVQQWLTMAADSTGQPHLRLQYDLPNTWSQKYNLLFDRVLGLNLFNDTMYKTEEAFYQTKFAEFGFPLDNRANFTKGDWSMWVGAVSSDAFFQQVTHTLYTFAHKTPSRVPLTDWYDTVSGTCVGFRARPVMGGIMAKLLIAK